MSKRFFSLLLVFCLALSFAAPAFAATDEPSTIANDLMTNPGDGAGAKALKAELAESDKIVNAEDEETEAGHVYTIKDHYVPATYEAFEASYAKADALRDDFNNNVSPDDAALKAAAEDLTSKRAALDGRPEKAIIDALDAAIKAAEATAKDTSLAESATTKLKNTDIATAKAALTAAQNDANGTDKTVDARIAAIKATDAIKDAAADAAKAVNTVSLSIKEAKYEPSSSSGAGKGTIKVTLEKADLPKGALDEFKYTVTAKYEDKDAYTAKKDFQVSGGIAVDAITAANLGADEQTLVEGKKVVVTLSYAVSAGDVFDSTATKQVTVGEPITITISETVPTPTPAPAFAPADKGFVTDADATGFKQPVKGLTIEGHDQLYVSATSEFSKSKTGGLTGNANQYKWVLTWNGKSYAAPAISNKDELDVTAKAFDLATILTSDATKVKGGDVITVKLIDATGAETVALATWDITIPTLNTSELEELLATIPEDATLKADYGPSAKVTTLVVGNGDDFQGARKLKTNYVGTNLAATYANVEALGNKANKAEKIEAKGQVGKLEAALKEIYSVVALREKIEEVEKLDPANYSNWYEGLMGGENGALYNAIAGLLAATGETDSVKSALIVKNEKEHEIKPASAAPEDADAVKKLVDNLDKAQKALVSIAGDTSALEALIEAIPADSSKYTKSSWAAVEAAKKAAEDLLATKPGAADKEKIDKATADLQAALKGLVPVTGEIEKVTEGDKDYIIKDGEKLSGVQEVDGKLYYASVKDQHVFKGGLVTGEGGKKYLAGDDGVLKLGYQKVGDKAYYFAKDGHMLRNGIVTGTGKQYVAAKDGVLGTGLVTAANGNKYYCSVKDNHIMKAPKGKGTAPVIGPNGAKYTVNEKGVVVG